MTHIINVIKEVKENENFRKVLLTGLKSQLVVMSIKEGGEIGEETHEHVEQTFVVESGEGVAVLNGVESLLRVGDALVVPPGTRHNVRNIGMTPLKIFTVYTPPNHIDGRIHKTKEDADADTEDEAFGHEA